MIEIHVEGMDRLIRKFAGYPGRLKTAMGKAMWASLLILWENVPPYPAKPQGSSYDRTGTLGRSLGVMEGGGKAGKPTVYSVTGSGTQTIGKFGTNLNYAQYVVDPDRQAWMHKGRWWTMKHIKNKSVDKIKALWDDIVKKAIRD